VKAYLWRKRGQDVEWEKRQPQQKEKSQSTEKCWRKVKDCRGIRGKVSTEVIKSHEKEGGGGGGGVWALLMKGRRSRGGGGGGDLKGQEEDVTG